MLVLSGQTGFAATDLTVTNKGSYQANGTTFTTFGLDWSCRCVVKGVGTHSGGTGTRNYTSPTDSLWSAAYSKVEFYIQEIGSDTWEFAETVYPEGGEGGGSTDPGDGGTTDPGGGTDPGDGGTTDPGDGSTDPGDGGTDPGDGSGGECQACELLACPGWDELADKFADEIGQEIPPPPDWEEVADTMADELVPRLSDAIAQEFVDEVVPAMGDEMRDVLNDVLQHPEPPPSIQAPTVPTFDGTTNIPQPTDSTPPANPINFDNVPDIQVNPDNTGGINMLNADPTESLPHDSNTYMPIPGQETGGDKPMTKPIETPVPSSGGVAQPPAEQTPLPSTSNGEVPIPSGTNSPPPSPELPMPSDS